MGIFDIGVLEIPLPGHDPVKNLRAGRNLEHLQRYSLLEQAQGLPDSIPCDASAERVQF
jgi:hypothetical protein